MGAEPPSKFQFVARNLIFRDNVGNGIMISGKWIAGLDDTVRTEEE